VPERERERERELELELELEQMPEREQLVQQQQMLEQEPVPVVGLRRAQPWLDLQSLGRGRLSAR
jgi:hypothetical protein